MRRMVCSNIWLHNANVLSSICICRQCDVNLVSTKFRLTFVPATKQHHCVESMCLYSLFFRLTAHTIFHSSCLPVGKYASQLLHLLILMQSQRYSIIASYSYTYNDMIVGFFEEFSVRTHHTFSRAPKNVRFPFPFC